MGCVTFHLALKSMFTTGIFGGQAPVSHLLNYRQNSSVIINFIWGLYWEYYSASNNFSNLVLRPSYNMCARVGKIRIRSLQKLNIIQIIHRCNCVICDAAHEVFTNHYVQSNSRGVAECILCHCEYHIRALHRHNVTNENLCIICFIKWVDNLTWQGHKMSPSNLHPRLLLPKCTPCTDDRGSSGLVNKLSIAWCDFS